MVLGEGRHSCDCPDSRYCGAVYPYTRDIYAQIETAMRDGFDFIVTPISADVNGAEPRPDLDLSAAMWSSQVVGRLQSVDDGLHAMHAELASAAYLGVQAVIVTPPKRKKMVVNFARMLNLAISRVGGAGGCCPQVWLSFQLEAESIENHHDDDDDANQEGDDEVIKAWDAWNTIRKMCDESPRIGVVLVIQSGSSSSSETCSAAMTEAKKLSAARWMGEPLKAILLHAACFIPNKAGFPVLTKRLQEVVTDMFVRNVRVIFDGSVTDSINANDGTKTYDIDTDMHVDDMSKMRCSRYFWEYLSYLFRRMEPLSELEQMECGYRDVLQYPLQPLMDNLEASTYEVFERDAVKYDLYMEAVRARLLDMESSNGSGSGSGSGIFDDNGDEIIVVMVVGAGRGPIVTASLRAADSIGKTVRVYALEKNPNAIVTLRVKQSSDPLWANRVTIVPGDMRDPAVGSGANAVPQADIVVSELLGSFGDNELSPECLDGAQRFVRGFDDDTPGARRGVMIPQRYTSYLAPISCSKLWNDVRSGGGGGGGASSNCASVNSLQPFESPYVVKLHAHAVLAAPQPIFTFSHPVWPEELDCSSLGSDAERNSRDASVRFPIAIDTNSITRPPQRTQHIPPPGGRGADAAPSSAHEKDERYHPRACCHGFAGYFECTLYGDVKMSTLPESHSDNMYSWFPIYFPVRDPVDLPRGATVLEARIWRSASAATKKVWYEWCITSPIVSPVHNPGGRSYAMSL